MFNKSGLFVFVLTILQVYARYKNVVTDLIDDQINSGTASLSSTRIVSGWEAQPGQHPHHAALRMVLANGDMRTCGGSIISNVWVLSAAACVRSRVRAIVRVGVLDITDNNPNNIFETTEWYNHPNYNPSMGFQPYGVTLLKLPRPIVYTWLVKPIRIQSSADTYRNYDGEQVYTSGHGRISDSAAYSNMLRWVYLRAISDNECLRIYSSIIVFDTTICARYFNETTQSICSDDTGGPLVHVGFDGVPTLIGVSYFVNGRCDGSPTGFHRTGAFIPWFKELTGIDFENTSTTSTSTTAPTTTTTTTTTTPTTITIPISTTPTTSSTTIPTTTTPIPTSTTTVAPTITTSLTPVIPTSTSSTITSTTKDPGPEDFTPEDNTTAPPDDSDEKEEDEESDSSDSNENNDMAQLLKRLQVDVKVKVAYNKYKLIK